MVSTVSQKNGYELITSPFPDKRKNEKTKKRLRVTTTHQTCQLTSKIAGMDSSPLNNRAKKVHRSLENFDEYNITPPLLTSPRSAEACRRQGIEPEELVFRCVQPSRLSDCHRTSVVFLKFRFSGTRIRLQSLGSPKTFKKLGGNIMKRSEEKSWPLFERHDRYIVCRV